MPREAFLLALGLLLHVPAAAAPAPAASAPPVHAPVHGGPDARLFWQVLTQ